MIVRELPTGQLLCLNQTTHAYMAEQFCRHWGNHHFDQPTPYAATMLAIGQHDNGWYEWELAPRLRADGYPMDFLHDDDWVAKVSLWQRGIQRIFAQHPYAALLVGRHAALLYEGSLMELTDPAIRKAVIAFIAEQQQLLITVRTLYHHEPSMAEALSEQTIDANTHLLQFGDFAALQVSMPWGAERTMKNCPFHGRERINIVMHHEGEQVTFDPWPFGVDHFMVTVHGKVLNARTFADVGAYHTALAAAPLQQLTWQVSRG